MELEDDSDTHICLRCRTTIIGLEQYVNHRKGDCPGKVKPCSSENNQENSIASIDDNRSSNQNSLSTNIEQTGSFNESTLSNFNLQQDAFFSLLELQCKISPVKQPASLNEKITSSSWNKDTAESGLVNIPDLDFGNVENGKTAENESYRSDEEDGFDFINELSGNDESDDEFNPPNSHTGGKWKPGSRPVSSPQEGKWHSSPSPPPASHTKGKWLPGKQKLDHNYVSYNPADAEEQESDKAEENDEKYNCEMCSRSLSTKYGYHRHISTPFHQKRMLSVVKSTPSVIEDEAKNEMFDCSYCNRSLSSKFAFSRHVTTSYHQKRIKDSVSKDKVEGSENVALEDSNYIRKSSRIRTTKHLNNDLVYESVVTKEKNGNFECPACERSFLNQKSLVQHLLTNLHVKRAEHHPSRNKLILENIDLLARHSLFQCGICSYYFNHHSYLIEHCDSNVHKANSVNVKNHFFCSGCNYTCENNKDLLDHLSKSEHKDQLSLINHKCTVIIKERNADFNCKACSSQFASSFLLKRHQKRCKEGSCVTCEHSTQSYVCDLCKWQTTSRTNLNIHLRVNHTKEKPYKCALCNKAFSTAGSLQIHKLSIRHKRQLVAEQLLNPTTKCKHCSKIFLGFQKLKEHTKQAHPDMIITCRRCSGVFVLESEFNIHVCRRISSTKTKNQTDSDLISDKSKLVYSCEKCVFKCSSLSHLVYHQLLHQSPEQVPVIKREASNENTENPSLDLNKGNDDNSNITDISENNSTKESVPRHNVKMRMVKKYQCPYCQKYFQKAILRSHLNIHTGERPYKCTYCTMAFAQKGTLYIHLKRHSGFKKFKCDQCSFAAEKPSRLKRHKLIHDSVRPRSFLCEMCGAGYHDRWGLKHHMKLHFGKDYKCPQEGCSQAFRCQSELDIHLRVHTDEKPFLCDKCGYRGRSQHQLTKHRRSHTGERPFKCKYCSYSAHLSPHLQRHMRIHTGSKPYKCPYCNYTCNTQENIRKHILKTKKHEGKKVYPCRFCDFGCNAASEYKTHLLENHSDVVDGENTDVVSLLAGVYNRSDDKKTLETPIPYVPRTERQKQSTQINNKKKDKKKRPKRKPNENAREQVVYAIEVPKIDVVETANEHIFQHNLNNPETILLPMASNDNISETDDNQSHIYIPTSMDESVVTQEDATIITDAITDDTLIESSTNTILIYLPLT